MERQQTGTGSRIPRLAALMLALTAVAILTVIPNATPIAADHDDRPGPKVYVDCPQTHVEEGDSVKVYLVRTDLNGHEKYQFGGWWHTHAKSADGSDYARLDGVWHTSTEAERIANRMALTSARTKTTGWRVKKRSPCGFRRPA